MPSRLTLYWIGVAAGIVAVLAGVLLALSPSPEPPRVQGFASTIWRDFAGGAPCVSGLADDAEWTRHVIDGSETGADGVDLADVNGDGLLDVVTAWEQTHVVTVSLHPGYAAASDPWSTIDAMTSVTGAEDAKWCDLDQDGVMDIVAAGETRVLRIAFGPAPYTTKFTLNTVQDWIQVQCADIDDDGDPDIVAGSKVGSEDVATLGWFQAPADPRTATWAYTEITQAAWIMSIEALDFDADGDVDVVASDRQCYDPGGGNVCTKVGTNSFENTAGNGSAWTHRQIRNGLGQSKMLSIDDIDGDGDLDVLHCSSIAGPTSTMYYSRNNGGFTSWTSVAIAAPADFGRCQQIVAGDLNGDGFKDLVYTSDDSGDGAGSTRSAVLWSPGPAFTERWEMSGPTVGSPDGDKYDNAVIYDVNGDGAPDVVTTEQDDNIGIVWFENPDC